MWISAVMRQNFWHHYDIHCHPVLHVKAGRIQYIWFLYSFSTNINSNNSIRCFTVQLEYLCYNIHIFWNTYKNISRVNIPQFYYVSRLFMYNQTMIEMNRGKYLKRIKDIQLYKQQRNKALQMAHTTFMSEYKREYKYCTLH